MPQATDELRAEWNGPEDATAMQFLKEAGFTLQRDWTWKREGATWENITDKERSAMTFLFQEWDFGGLAE